MNRRTMENIKDRAAVERAVRYAVGRSMRTDVERWPADQPLGEMPDGMFDSLAKLESLSLIETELGVGPLSVEDADWESDTIAGITAWVLRTLGDHA